MLALPVHPALVHLPIGMSFLLPLLALSIAFAITRTWLPRGAWLLVVMVSAIITGAAFFTRQTGEQEEHRLNDPSLQRGIHEHEESANWFIASTVLTSLLAVAVAFIKSVRAFSVASFLVAVFTFFPLSIALRTGYLGGRLVFEQAAGQVKPEAMQLP